LSYSPAIKDLCVLHSLTPRLPLILSPDAVCECDTGDSTF